MINQTIPIGHMPEFVTALQTALRNSKGKTIIFVHPDSLEIFLAAFYIYNSTAPEMALTTHAKYDITKENLDYIIQERVANLQLNYFGLTYPIMLTKTIEMGFVGLN